jgi:hypothetical protein
MSARLSRWWLLVVVLAACGRGPLGCSEQGATVEFFKVEGLDGEHEFSDAERDLIEGIAVSAVDEVRALLPALPKRVTIRVHAAEVGSETGEDGTASAGMVLWTVDPKRGVSAVARAWLRPCLFHELHHMVRDATIPRATLLDNVVTEGLADAFERDFAGASPPWAVYPAEVGSWFEELSALPPDTARRGYLSRLPDGRRGVAHKVGTYLADRARARSGRSAAQLVSASTVEVIHLASGGNRPP